MIKQHRFKNIPLFTYVGTLTVFSFCVLYVGTHTYLIKLLGITSFHPLFLYLGVLLLAFSYPSSQVVNHREIGSPFMQLALTRIGHLWLGVLWVLLMCIVSVHLLNSSLKFMGFGAIPTYTLYKSILVLTVMMTGLGMYMAYKPPKIVRYYVDRRERYDQNRSLRVVQLSDLHLGYDLGRRFLRKIVKQVNQLEPDLIVLTGDIMESPPSYFSKFSKDLKQFQSRLGTFAITGNHDFYNGIDAFLEIMKTSNIHVLENESVDLEGIQLMGIHDPTANKAKYTGFESNLGKAMQGFSSERPSILLAHQPQDYEPAVEQEVDMILCGHTHKGQIFPFHVVAKKLYEYISGNHMLGNNTNLIISQGTGFWGPPLRLGSDSQVVMIDFQY
ncbi:metallophosphoesterase [Deltaproteobacteria bacterium TL4]